MSRSSGKRKKKRKSAAGKVIFNQNLMKEIGKDRKERKKKAKSTIFHSRLKLGSSRDAIHAI
jgi:hypothetical protein